MSLAEHHRRKTAALHFQRFSWFGFMAAGLFIVQLIANMQTADAKNVLAYATNISRSDLHSLHNQHRAEAGLGGLSLNSKLNSAAQAKAEHMIANDYWSHVAPDGTTPWYFFDQAGYDYTSAGENLAYGFLTSDGVMNGWMNSSGHRANVLGSYVDVGFGIANGATYQGGENTVVVAMYGTPVDYQAPAATTEETPALVPAPLQTAPTTPPAPVATAPIAQPAAVPIVPTPAEKPAVATIDPKPAAPLRVPQDEQRITTIQSALASRESWPLYASMVIIAISSLGFGITHMRLLQLNWNRGVRFALTHPMLDAAVVTSVCMFVLSATVGFVR